MNPDYSPTIIRKNPVVIVKNFIVLQLAAVAVFFLSGILIDYGEIYGHLPLPNSLSFHVAEAIGIFFLETALVFYIFFRWHKEYYDIRNGQIIHGGGIIFRQKEVLPIKDISSVGYKQGPLGRLAKYGHLELKQKTGEKPFVLDHIADPQTYVQLIASLKSNAEKTGIAEPQEKLEEIISRGENEHVEFKASFRWDLDRGKINKNLEKMAIKTIAAFLNSEGGRLIIGVNDRGEIIGLDRDFESLPKSNHDGFQNHFTNVFHEMIGPEFRHLIELTFTEARNKNCCLIRVAPSDRPVYLKNENSEEFYIRTGNGTTSLKLSEAAAYAESKWRGRGI